MQAAKLWKPPAIVNHLVIGISKMRKLLKAFVRDERGVSAMEYAVLAGIVAVALGAVGATFSTKVTTMFNTMFTAIQTQQAK
jgi:pilus assembly protein Flp/PilA